MTTEQLKQLKENLQRANDSLTKKDFEASFKVLIDFVKKLQATLTDKNDKVIQELTALIQTLADKLETLNQQKLLSSQVKMDKALEEQRASLNYIRDWTRNLKNGRDGKDADEAIVAENASKIALETLEPKLLGKDAIKEEISKAGDLIATSLENLDDDKKLEISAIKDLQKELDELRAMKGRVLGGGGGFSRMAMEQYFIDDDTPAEVPNGVITDFTPTYSFMASSLKVFNDGQRMKIGATKDYTIVSGKVVYNTAPLADVIITFDYRRS